MSDEDVPAAPQPDTGLAERLEAGEFVRWLYLYGAASPRSSSQPSGVNTQSLPPIRSQPHSRVLNQSKTSRNTPLLYVFRIATIARRTAADFGPFVLQQELPEEETETLEFS